MNQKTTLFSLCCMFVFSISESISAQQIYSNGPISTGANSSAATPVVAPTGYTWSELQAPNTTLGSSGHYNNALTSDFSLSDEFVVPVGETWNLTNVDVFGYQTGYTGTVIPIDVLRVRIWNGDPSLTTSTVVFGNLTTNVLNNASSAEALVYRASVPSATTTTRRIWKFNANVATTLTSGTYWIEFQVHALNDAALFFPPVTILNTLSIPASNAKIRSLTTWTNLADGGSTNPLSVPFNINGSVTLSTDDFQYSSNILIYPNPATNTIKIKDISNSSNAKIEVIDISGRIIKTLNSTLDSELSIDISELTSGNYMLRLQSENGTTVKKFIKI